MPPFEVRPERRYHVEFARQETVYNVGETGK
jgi:hypothetical protein